MPRAFPGYSAYFFPGQREVDLEALHEPEQAVCWSDEALQSGCSCEEMSEPEHALGPPSKNFYLVRLE